MTKPASPKILLLRSCKPGGESPSENAKGFIWPELGVVKCKDWDPKPECGNGLHGLKVGQQNPGIWYSEKDAVWKVVEVKECDIIDLGGKSKFKQGKVVFSGTPAEVSAYLARVSPGNWYGVLNVGGNWSTNTGGNWSINTGGNDSTNTGGERSTNTGGNNSKNTGGNYSKNTGGERSKNTGGYMSKNTGGNYSTNTGGNYSTNTGGNYSTNTGGYMSTNTGGDGSTNTGGNGSTNTGGCGALLRWDLGRSMVVAVVGENGIKPNIPYVCVDGKVVEKK
jgi:hypothetical protein